VDERTISVAGDPFYAAAKSRPCTCYEGTIYIGRVVESKHDLGGEVVEYRAAAVGKRHERSDA
jgi:hypothetical protein